MLEKASALFSSRGANLQSYIYGTSALTNGQSTDKVRLQRQQCVGHAPKNTASEPRIVAVKGAATLVSAPHPVRRLKRTLISPEE